MIFTFCAHGIKVTVPVLENRQASSHKQHCYFYTALPPCMWIYYRTVIYSHVVPGFYESEDRGCSTVSAPPPTFHQTDHRIPDLQPFSMDVAVVLAAKIVRAGPPSVIHH